MTATRRLAAILVADVVGYSRLMEADEAGTLATLKERRKTILEPVVREHGGRVVKFMGDGALIEIASAVNAVSAALELQARMVATNATLSDDRRIVLRIGINLGDVIGDGNDIYGDGANIAARLEALASPGDVCVSGKIVAETQGKAKVSFVDLGDHVLRNIATPVRIYRAIASQNAPADVIVADWSAPEKQSIAVLPFVNMSGDAEQEYFSDGITEDIITDLSRFKSLFVISRNSSFNFKRRVMKARDIGRELSATFVVEGSVRKAGSRVRITAQLIETVSDNHLWAERYDRDIADIFEVQDEVVRSIAGAVPGEVTRRLVEHARRKPPENLTAYECTLRGRWAFAHGNEGIAKAIEWYQRAVDADPSYATALAGLAQSLSYGVFMLGSSAQETFSRAAALASRAASLDDRNPSVLSTAAYVHLLRGENVTAQSYVERALALNPNDPDIVQTMGEVLAYGEHCEEALNWFAQSARLVPYSQDDRRLDLLSETYYMLGRYDEVRRLAAAYDGFENYCPLAAACAQLGDSVGAEKATGKFLAEFCEGDARMMLAAHVNMCARPEDRDHWLDGYRKAGLPV